METHPVRSRRESIINPDLLTHWGRGGAGRVTDLSPSSGLWVRQNRIPQRMLYRLTQPFSVAPTHCRSR